MGFGDHLMAIGEAWRLHNADPERRQVALGDGIRLRTPPAALIDGLAFLATPGDLESGRPLIWLKNYHTERPYIDYAAMREVWLQDRLARLRTRPLGRIGTPLQAWTLRRLNRFWSRKRLLAQARRYVWKEWGAPTPAIVHLSDAEQGFADALAAPGPYVTIEPDLKEDAPPAKRWPLERHREVARALSAHTRVIQLGPPGTAPLDPVVEVVTTSTFREALAALSRASAHIGHEGGLHHGAAAMGTSAVVIFGGFIGPRHTGYENHVNLTGGAVEACGTRFVACPHCTEAMDRISVSEVVEAVMRLLDRER